MTLSRQQAFQQLRGPCVELSSVALKFRGKQASIKDVLLALEAVKKALSSLAERNALDEKLAEYSFFPLTHIFNEAQRLSSSCLETAITCVIILARKGWRSHLSSDLGKQLLILMTMIGSSEPKGSRESPSDDLKEVSLICIDTVITQLIGRQDSKHVFDDVGSRSIVDQVVYMLLEAITENESDQVQVAGAEALLHLIAAISNRVLLASLLPRTASSLTQVLKQSSKARRTRKVLIIYLRLLTSIMLAVLADHVVYPLEGLSPVPVDSENDQLVPMDKSWLQATVAQVKIVLIQVTRLRDHESADVRRAVADLCLMVIRDCSTSLADSIPVTVESLLSISQSDGGASVMVSLEDLASSNAGIAEVVRSRFYACCQSFPRIMQANDEQPKMRLLGQLGSSVSILNKGLSVTSDTVERIVKSLLAGLSLEMGDMPPVRMLEEQPSDMSLTIGDLTSETLSFQNLALAQAHEKVVFSGVQRLLHICGSNGLSNQMARICIDKIETASVGEQASAMWLALACLRNEFAANEDFTDILEIDSDDTDLNNSRAGLISELYTSALPFVLGEADMVDGDSQRLKALAIECVVLQAQQLESSYRPELMDTLYPILSLLGSPDQVLRNHSMAALNLLSQACRYASSSDMLIDNVDYLINSVALKLNSFDISPQAPQVILMMLRLCGARIVPYLDDLIGSIFSALDSFHGYPRLVELLFRVLKGVVDQSQSQSSMTITDSSSRPSHRRESIKHSTVQDIAEDLRKRQLRKRKHQDDRDKPEPTPHRPWKSDADISPPHEFEDNIKDLETQAQDDDQSQPPNNDDKIVTLPKPHQLLLDIAKSTSPHLSSPSPQVRHLLLDLLSSVAPLLSTHENTFLPMINTVWPSIVARMLTLSDTSLQDPDAEAETSYNICAAANTITILCREAGNFMSTRIEETFPQLRKLFHQVQESKKTGNKPRGGVNNSLLDITPKLSSETVLVKISSSSSRTSKSLILSSLLSLLTTILTDVRITDDIGDEIIAMLFPFALPHDQHQDTNAKGRNEIRTALETYNADAFWLLEQKQKARTKTTFTGGGGSGAASKALVVEEVLP